MKSDSRRLDAAEIAFRRGWSETGRVDIDHGRFDSSCAWNSDIGGRAEADIASHRGISSTYRNANDHDKFDKFCGTNTLPRYRPRVRRADDEIACSKGRSENASAATAHAGLPRLCSWKALILGRDDAARAFRSGRSFYMSKEIDQARFAIPLSSNRQDGGGRPSA